MDKEVLQTLKPIKDPDIGCSIVDMGLIYNIENKEDLIEIEMTLTTPGCPYGPQIIDEVRCKIKEEYKKDIDLKIVWDPPWSLDFISDELKLDMGLDF